MQPPIYLDYNATTSVDPAVVDAMVPYLSERFGNASSAHPYGYEAHRALDRAREQVAALIGAGPEEIVFTGGGSESDNLAVKGAVFAALDRRPHVISTTVEHPAVLNTLRYLRARFGVDLTLVPVDQCGLVSPEAIRAAIRPQTVLVSIMHANNEVGTLQPMQEIAEVAHRAGALFHADSAQSAGKIEIEVADLGVDMLTIAGHKLYGPKGIGALYARRGLRIDPLIHGAGQEQGLRAGTENVASIVGLGKACDIARGDLANERARLTELRDRLHALLEARIPGLLLNGHPSLRLPNTLNVSFPEAIGQAVLEHTPDVAASTGSACHSGLTEPSPVLMAMGLPAERALGAVRLSLGRWTTERDVERAADLLAEGYLAATALSPSI
jgi:cysteine desulfurase